VPKHKLPASISGFAAGIFFRIQANFAPEKYGDKRKPVFSRITLESPFSANSSVMPAARPHCHTMALQSGSPVVRFQHNCRFPLVRYANRAYRRRQAVFFQRISGGGVNVVYYFDRMMFHPTHAIRYLGVRYAGTRQNVTLR
jgi:hypothetical protein